ncbi:ATP citrate lyase subunit B 2 [Actinidia rufa]|uniref:ATP citrate lyase subunit B 2 n=1 Tax=Actinidia rufa TaxID=165716 RepID=A0A7J0GT41_9ERIC|nr:ATP citrate lyase subunit B 2 [Actinidia rufa]
MDLNKTDEDKSNGYIFGGIEGSVFWFSKIDSAPIDWDWITTDILIGDHYFKKRKNLSLQAPMPFSSAGVWSHLTLLWINPLFGKGRTQKLKLPHRPSILQSETAFIPSSLVEESLRKQNTEYRNSLLANSHCPCSLETLALNGFLAARQCKPPPWTDSCIHLLLCKGSGISLSQRQWYFGTQGIGIRVRVALMVLIYKKSLSVKYGGMSNGKVVNFITVDVERVGDFFWYMHGDFSLLLFLGTLFSLLKMVGDFSLLDKESGESCEAHRQEQRRKGKENPAPDSLPPYREPTSPYLTKVKSSTFIGDWGMVKAARLWRRGGGDGQRDVVACLVSDLGARWWGMTGYVAADCYKWRPTV